MSEEEIKCLNNCGFANVTQLLLAYVSLQQENSQLKDNWNKLKDFIEKNVVCLKSGNLLVELNVDKLYKILELESGNSDE